MALKKVTLGLAAMLVSGAAFAAITLIPAPPLARPPIKALHGVIAEGDSISYFLRGSYTEIYARARPNVELHGTAIGGAGINNPSNGNGLMQRLSTDLELHPAAVTVLIGANDLGNYPTTKAWLSALWTYVAAVKATGAKVAVGTVLPLYVPGNAIATARHNGRRVVANAAIRAAVGSKIDEVIDFAADPIMGLDATAMNTRWYRDGTHPTDKTVESSGLSGQGRLAAIYTPVVDRLLNRR